MGLGATEAIARKLRLDLYQGRPVAEFTTQDPPMDLGLPFPPRMLEVDADGFRTVYGTCRRDFAGSTLLVIGDSTTLQGFHDGRPSEVDGTWPQLVADRLGPDWQVCVLAEVGWHPQDELAAAELLDLSFVDRTVVLLCVNDLTPAPRRYVDRIGDQWAIIEGATEYTAWAPLGTPPTLWRSEAFRYLSWRMATATGDGVQVPTDGGATSSVDAIAGLDALLHPTFYYLPELVPGAHRAHALAVGADAGVEMHVIALPDDPLPLRRGKGERYHLGIPGHALVAAQILSDLQP
ncbi:MAG: SGNH/GDSL hydrolase family protein [Alphaproteobacteria bacterium]|nr:SGNH/GDSL hydrolase family protein [Alphaproteobacteria bacterium]